MKQCLGIFACATALLSSMAGRSQEVARKTEVKVVKYGGLKEIVRKHRGKVVVVIFWSTFDLPAIRLHGQLLDMHRKQRTEELVGVSVCMDQLDGETDTKAKLEKHVLARLQTLRSEFTKVILDERIEDIERLVPQGVACIYVFNRQGKWHRVSFVDESPDWSRLDDLIVDLLKEKQ